eukprot:gene5146-3696_t
MGSQEVLRQRRIATLVYGVRYVDWYMNRTTKKKKKEGWDRKCRGESAGSRERRRPTGRPSTGKDARRQQKKYRLQQEKKLPRNETFVVVVVVVVVVFKVSQQRKIFMLKSNKQKSLCCCYAHKFCPARWVLVPLRSVAVTFLFRGTANGLEVTPCFFRCFHIWLLFAQTEKGHEINQYISAKCVGNNKQKNASWNPED